jgi:hypothetical protein
MLYDQSMKKKYTYENVALKASEFKTKSEFLFNYTTENLEKEALKYQTRTEFLRNAGHFYRASVRNNVLEHVCSHMPRKAGVAHNKKWTEETIRVESSKYKNRYEFKKNNASAFMAAKKYSLLEVLYPSKGAFRNVSYSDKEIQEEVSKYKTKYELKTNNPYLYRIILKRVDKDKLFSNFPVHASFGATPHNKKWTEDTIFEEAKKFESRSQFEKEASGACDAAKTMKILGKVCAHMKKIKRDNWTTEEIQNEALKYTMRSEFIKNNAGAYQSAQRKSLIDEMCAHMKKAGGISIAERFLFNLIKEKYPKTQRLKDRKVKIVNKTHIKGFDIDIYIPELRKGIEFDGTYWHSKDGLKRSRADWPDEDLENYHQIKDEYFKNKGIFLFHVNEAEWNKNKENCIEKCLEFLET